MGYRDGGGFRKFYQQQVEWILALIDRYYQDSITTEQYLKMMDQLGQEPNLDEIPPELDDFPLEVQEAFVVHLMLPDKWDGASGQYMGKDWAALEPLLNINEIPTADRKILCFFLKFIESANTININESLKRQQDATQRRMKSK